MNKKIIKLTESDLVSLVKRILKEDVTSDEINPKNLKFGDGGNANPTKTDDVKILQQKLFDMGLLKTKSMKPTGYFGNLTKAALSKALGEPETKVMDNTKPSKLVNQNKISNNKTQKDVKSIQPKTVTSVCQVITPKSDIKDLKQIITSWKQIYPQVETYKLINGIMGKLAESFKLQGIPQKISCELALIKIRPGYKDKNIFVVDSINKLIYLYDKSGKFIAKSEIISGKNKQSVDPKTVAKALMSWSEQANSIGFKWVNGKGYVDVTGKNRKYNHDLIYSNTDKSKTRFLPKGIYTTGNLKSDDEYSGEKNNMLFLSQNNKQIAQAIHGYYVEQPRTEALKKAEQVLSNPNDPKVGQEFLNLVNKGGVNLSQSYGCINVPNNFLEYLREYGANSYVFNIGEGNENYLVNNTENYFEKMMNSQSCPSPQSLGAMTIDNIA